MFKKIKKTLEKKKKEWIQLNLGRVTMTGSAAIAGMLQLMSGLISKRISLFISTVWSLNDNNFFCSLRRKQMIGAASSSVARKTCQQLKEKENNTLNASADDALEKLTK